MNQVFFFKKTNNNDQKKKTHVKKIKFTKLNRT